MIPQRYIEEWRGMAPWDLDPQIEQDLVIARTVVELFSDDLLKKSLAFRGGTALHKLYIRNVVNVPPTQKQFLANMNEKMTDRDFREDIYLLLKKGIKYDVDAAWEWVRKELVEKI